MSGKLNFSRVLKGSSTRRGYLTSLTLSQIQAQSLREARNQVRSTLRSEMPRWNSLLKAKGLVEFRHIELASQVPPLQPKFRMQGSGIYGTLNIPAQMPPQEMDYDDGIFLPTSFVNDLSNSHPVLAAKGYFEMVEAIVAPLCSRRGWTLNRRKNNCVRIQISTEAHVDLALYAIPDMEYHKLAKARAAALRGNVPLPPEWDLETNDALYRDLLGERIMLAQRDIGWTESNPQQLEKWFLDAISDHGEVIRRLCRYLKGWRDYQWTTGGPSSIALMSCVVTVFDELDGKLPEGRDDLALKALADRLVDLFSQSISNPVLPGQHLDEGWSQNDRLEFTSRANALKMIINNVLNRVFDKGLALSELKKCFGGRIPNDTLLIDLVSLERIVLEQKPKVVKAPKVPRTTSG